MNSILLLKDGGETSVVSIVGSKKKDVTNKSTTFMDLRNWDCKLVIGQCVIVSIVNILIYFIRDKKHERNLLKIFEVFKRREIYANVLKYDFRFLEVNFFGHMVNHKDIKVGQLKWNQLWNEITYISSIMFFITYSTRGFTFRVLVAGQSVIFGDKQYFNEHNSRGKMLIILDIRTWYAMKVRFHIM